MEPDELLHTARVLLSAGRGRPPMACRRRAVSSAYYALFHCLARDCADLLIGGRQADRSERAWQQVYRSLEHTACKERCRHPEIRTFPQEVRDFALAFIELQDRRHSADYDPAARFTKDSALSDIERAEEAVASFRAASQRDRRAFCAHVLFKRR